MSGLWLAPLHLGLCFPVPAIFGESDSFHLLQIFPEQIEVAARATQDSTYMVNLNPASLLGYSTERTPLGDGKNLQRINHHSYQLRKLKNAVFCLFVFFVDVLAIS